MTNLSKVATLEIFLIVTKDATIENNFIRGANIDKIFLPKVLVSKEDLLEMLVPKVFV